MDPRRQHHPHVELAVRHHRIGGVAAGRAPGEVVETVIHHGRVSTPSGV